MFQPKYEFWRFYSKTMAELEKLIFFFCVLLLAFPLLLDQQAPGGSNGKESTCNAGDPGSILVFGRSPGEENGYSLQYSYLENSIDRRGWRARLHGVTKSRTWLSDRHFHFSVSYENWDPCLDFLLNQMFKMRRLNFYRSQEPVLLPYIATCPWRDEVPEFLYSRSDSQKD